MQAPVGVVSSSFALFPLITKLEFLKISRIALAGFDIVPCENVTEPPPTETGKHTIFSSNNPKSSNAIVIPIISTKYQYLTLH